MIFNSHELYNMQDYTENTQSELKRLPLITDKISKSITEDDLNMLVDLITGGCAYEVACALDIQLHPKRYRSTLLVANVESF